MFADDIDILIPDDSKIWKEVQYTIRCFEDISGLKVNYDKTNVYKLGSARKSRALDYSMRKLQWSEGYVNVLGVELSVNCDGMMEKI